MTEPFPRGDDGLPAYEWAAREMFGEDGVSPRSPAYINDGAETLAVVRLDLEAGTATLARLDVAVNRPTWDVDLAHLWTDWMHGELTFRRRRFLEPHEESFNGETEAVLARSALASLADYAAEDVARHGVALPTEVREAVRRAHEALGYEGLLAKVVGGDD